MSRDLDLVREYITTSTADQGAIVLEYSAAKPILTGEDVEAQYITRRFLVQRNSPSVVHEIVGEYVDTYSYFEEYSVSWKVSGTENNEVNSNLDIINIGVKEYNTNVAGSIGNPAIRELLSDPFDVTVYSTHYSNKLR